jgi:hypothetical protein
VFYHHGARAAARAQRGTFIDNEVPFLPVRDQPGASFWGYVMRRSFAFHILHLVFQCEASLRDVWHLPSAILCYIFIYPRFALAWGNEGLSHSNYNIRRIDTRFVLKSI